MNYHRLDSETGNWVDFPEFIKFYQPTWAHSPEHFLAWVIRQTQDGNRLTYELMREKVI